MTLSISAGFVPKKLNTVTLPIPNTVTLSISAGLLRMKPEMESVTVSFFFWDAGRRGRGGMVSGTSSDILDI